MKRRENDPIGRSGSFSLGCAEKCNLRDTTKSLRPGAPDTYLLFFSVGCPNN